MNPKRRKPTSAKREINVRNENRKNLENTIDFFDEKMTKQAVGRLFEDYVSEGEKNYFAPSIRDDENEYYYSSDADEYYYDEETGQYYVNEYNYDENSEYYDNYDDYAQEQAMDFEPEDGYEFDADYLQQPKHSEPTDYSNVRAYSPRRKRSGRSSAKKSAKPAMPASRSQRKQQRVKPDMDNISYNDLLLDKHRGSSLALTFSSIVSVVLLIVSGALFILLSKTNAQLKIEKANVTQMTATAVASTNLLNQVEDLQNQLKVLKDENETLKQESVKNESENSESLEPDSEETITEYVVQPGDSIWKISKKVYGNGDMYIKILEANNMTNEDTLISGQKLVIPPK